MGSYGCFHIGDHKLLAHRVAYEMLEGPIPGDLQVLHTCDNPLCTRRSHLFLGTQADNMADMRAKGRQRKSRISAADQAIIRERHRKGERQSDLARAFSCSQALISLIVNRRLGY